MIEFFSLGAAGLVQQDKGEEKGSKQMRSRLVLTFGVLLGWGPHLAAEVLYTITDLGTLGGKSSFAANLNNAGQIVGQASTSTEEYHAFLYSDGQMMDLGTLGGHNSSAASINNAGQITGNSETPGGTAYTTHAFLYSDGQMQDLGTLGGISSGGVAINNAGQITGSLRTSTVDYHAFLYSDGQTQDLGTLGGSSSGGSSINNAGQVVGVSQTSTSSNYFGFLYSNGQMTNLGTLGLPYTASIYADRINDAGQIAGYAETSSDPNFSVHAFLYSNGQFTDLGTLGGNISFAYGINNAGQIVGVADTSTGDRHGFLYSDGQMRDLNDLIDLTQIDPALRNIPLAPSSINDRGQIVANQLIYSCITIDTLHCSPSIYHAYLLTPVPGTGPCWGWFCGSGGESGNTDNSGHPGTPPARAISLRNGSDQPDTQSGSVQR